MAAPRAVGTSAPRCAVDRADQGDLERQLRSVRAAAHPRRTARGGQADRREAGRSADARGRDRRRQPQALGQDHHARAARCPRGAGLGGSGLQRLRSRSAVGGRHHVCQDLDGVSVRGGGARCLQPPGGGLGDGRPSAHRTGPGRAEHGPLAAPCARGDSSQRPGLAVHVDPFGARCAEAGVRPSTGSVGDAYDNALCESFFATAGVRVVDRRSCSAPTPRRAWRSSNSSKGSTTGGAATRRSATGRRPTSRPLTAGRQRPERCRGGGIGTPPRRRKRRDGDPRASISRAAHVSGALRPDSPGEGRSLGCGQVNLPRRQTRRPPEPIDRLHSSHQIGAASAPTPRRAWRSSSSSKGSTTGGAATRRSATGRRPTSRPLTAGRQRPERCRGGGIGTPPRRRRRRDGDPRASIFRYRARITCFKAGFPPVRALPGLRPSGPARRHAPEPIVRLHLSTNPQAAAPLPPQPPPLTAACRSA